MAIRDRNLFSVDFTDPIGNPEDVAQLIKEQYMFPVEYENFIYRPMHAEQEIEGQKIFPVEYGDPVGIPVPVQQEPLEQQIFSAHENSIYHAANISQPLKEPEPVGATDPTYHPILVTEARGEQGIFPIEYHPISYPPLEMPGEPASVTPHYSAPPSPLSFIMVRNLKKAYMGSATAARLVLNDISFSVERGEFLIITGPPGAGKSTLLRILGCMERPSKGEYWFAERKINLFPMDKLARLRNQQLGFVCQQPDLLPRTSALQNVALPLLYAGFSEAEQKRRAQKVLQAVGLQACVRRIPEQLSHGQQVRVALARALVNSPSLLLADDPTRNMDARGVRETMAALQALNQRNLTIILVTRNADLAPYAKRHILLCDGKVVYDRPMTDMQMDFAMIEPTDEKPDHVVEMPSTDNLFYEEKR